MPGAVDGWLPPGNGAAERPVDLDGAGVQLEGPHLPADPVGELLPADQVAVERGSGHIGDHRPGRVDDLAVGESYPDGPAVVQLDPGDLRVGSGCSRRER